MKKALVILLALIVSVGAFAQTQADQVATVSGDATLEWGVDLDSKATGFKNSSTMSVKLPIITKGTVTKGGDGDVYGEIKFKDLEWNLTSAPLAGAVAGSVESTIYFKPFSVSVFNAPSLSPYKNAQIVDGDVTGAVAGFTYGTTIKYDQEPVTFGVKVLSKGDWTANTNNDYAAGMDFTFVAVKDVAKINLSAAMAFGGTTAVFAGLDAPITIADVVKGLVITPAVDLDIGTAVKFDAGANVQLKLSDKNSDDKLADVTFKAFYGQDSDLEIKLAFQEPLSACLIENVALNAAFQMIDVLKETPLAWKLDAGAGYKLVIDDTNNVVANASFATDQASANSLKMDVTFTNTQVANTTISVKYESGNLLASTAVLGKIVAAAKVKF